MNASSNFSTDHLLQPVLLGSPATVRFFEAVRDTDGSIVDFIVRSGNEVPANPFLHPLSTVLNRRLMEVYPALSASDILEQYRTVVESGTPQQLETYHQDESTGGWFQVSLQPYGDGVILTALDISQQKKTQQQLEHTLQLLQGIINSSPANIRYYEALREPTSDGSKGPIVDFVIRTGNDYPAYEGYRPTSKIKGHTLLEQFPNVQKLGLFDRYVTAIETQQQLDYETYYDATEEGLKGWFHGTVVPMGDGFVITTQNITARKEDELKRQQQADQLQQVMDGSQTSMALLRPVHGEAGAVVDFVFETVNPAFAKSLNITREALVGKAVSEYYTDYKSRGFFNRFVSVLESGTPLRFEMDYPIQGITNWYDLQVGPQVDGIVISSNNITELVQARQAQEQMAATLQDVLDSNPAGIATLVAVRDTNNQIVDFKIRSVNRSVREIVKLPLDGLIGKTIKELYPLYEQNGLLRLYADAVETNKSFRKEIYSANVGSGGWFDLSGVKHGDGLIISILDITIAKKAELAQQQLAALLQSVLDSSKTCFVLYEPIYDAEGKLIDFRYQLVNQAFKNLVRLNDQAIIGRTILDFAPDAETTGILGKYRKAIETNEAQEFEQEYTIYGKTYWFFIVAYPHEQGLVASFNDISQVRESQRQLEGLIKALKDSNDSLEHFAYVASHDLQEPLRKIQSFSQLMLDEYRPQLDEQGQDLLNRMQQAAGRMHQLIRDLLAYSRLSTTPRKTESVALTALVQEVLIDLDAVVAEKQAIVETGDLPIIKGDGFQLRQLFQNLVSNALKFTKADKTPLVRVRTVHATSATYQPTTMPNEGKLLVGVSVEDNGIGFDEQHTERIFKLFERLHGRSQYAGTGIGLALCKKIAENHGGYIDVQSRVGEGSVFTVWLPS